MTTKLRKCPYCGLRTTKETGKTIYPDRSDLWDKEYEACLPCEAWTGINNGQPPGRLANAELRKAKMAAHAAFDPIWKSGEMSRNQAYRWLASELGMRRKDCHIGFFDVNKCREVILAVETRKEGG